MAIPATSINPYLVDGPVVIVSSRRRPLGNFPEMNFGNMPNDDGNLLLSGDEASELRQSDP